MGTTSRDNSRNEALRVPAARLAPSARQRRHGLHPPEPASVVGLLCGLARLVQIRKRWGAEGPLQGRKGTREPRLPGIGQQGAAGVSLPQSKLACSTQSSNPLPIRASTPYRLRPVHPIAACKSPKSSAAARSPHQRVDRGSSAYLHKWLIVFLPVYRESCSRYALSFGNKIPETPAIGPPCAAGAHRHAARGCARNQCRGLPVYRESCSRYALSFGNKIPETPAPRIVVSRKHAVSLTAGLSDCRLQIAQEFSLRPEALTNVSIGDLVPTCING